MIKIDHQPNYITPTGLDSFFVSKYSLSAYSCCDDDIKVHITTPHTFEASVTKLNKGPIAFNDTGYSAYNPKEKTFKLTRKLLINAHAHCQKHAVVMVSNRQGMLRDLDIFKALSARQRLVIILPISQTSGDVKKMLQTMATLKASGLNVGVITPDIYKLSLNDAEILFKNSASAGADFIIPAKMTLSKNKWQLYQLLKILKVPPRVPMNIWRDWFDLSDTIYLAASHLQVLLLNNRLRYQKLGEFKRAYKQFLHTPRHNDAIIKWLNDDAPDGYSYDSHVKKYLTPLIDGAIYDYPSLSWQQPLDGKA